MRTFILTFLFIIFQTFALSQTKISGIVNNYASVKSINYEKDILTITNPMDFHIGDYVLIMQMKGAIIDSSNTNQFGKILDLKSCGNYEFASIINKSNDTITLKKNFCRKYDINGIVQLIKVPHYTNVIIDGELTAKKWDGSSGGVLAIKVDKTVIFNADINVNGLGFRGGKKHNSDWQCNQMDYYYASLSWQGAKKGEGIAILNSDKLAGRGALANGGGGGNCTNAGGAGGGNYGAGGHGGKQFMYACDSTDIGGLPGKGLPYSINDNKIYLAGGGGAGHENDFNGTSGGDGGGIVIIIASKIEGNDHTIFANGISAKQSENDAAGGGGAGGTILMSVDDYGTTNFNLETKGGNGGNCHIGPYVHCYGTGGGGAGGLVWLSSLYIPDNIYVNVDGGNNGYINNPISPCYNSNYGAYPGEKGSVLNEFNLNSCCDKTAFDYPDFSYSDGIDFVGSASNSNPTITLTPSKTWTVGAVWNKEKIPVNNGFTSTFEFRFSEGQDRYQNEKYPGADGIAFVIQNFYDKAYGSLGGGIGFAGIPNSFAIEFDTYKNYNPEYYIALSGINDPNENHLAVFCNGLSPNIAHHGSSANLATNDTIMDLVPDGRSFYAKIEYNIEPNTMKIWLDSTKDFLNPPAIVLNNLDLSQLLDLTCNEFAWVGFTSATGRAYEKHEILSWSLCPNPTSTIIPHPVITSGLNKVCGKQIAEYTSNHDNSVQYHWVIKNGSIIDGQNTETVAVKWGKSGIGILKLSQTIIGGCSDTAKKYVEIMPSPDADIEGDRKVCKGNTLIFKCKDFDYVNNKWEISGANIIGDNTGNEISVSFDTVGIAIITLMRENSLTFCADTSQISITVSSLPAPEIIEGKNPVYSNKEYEYVSNDEPDVNINWIVEGGEIVSGQGEKKVIIQWFTEGNGKIQLVHYNSKTGCSNIITKYIKIISNPDIKISGSKDACIEMVYTYSVNDSTEYYYKWIVDNGDIIGLDNKYFVNIIWHKEGINFIRLQTINKNNNLKDTITLSVNVHSLPEIVFNDMPDICLNDEPLELNFATPTGGNYYGDGIISNIFYPEEAGVGNHKITYIYTEPKTLCKNSAKNNIFVLPIPEQPKISQKGKVLVSSSAFEYQWYLDGEKIEGATNQQYKPLKTGYYAVVVSDENGCKSKISKQFFFDISDVEDDINATNSIRILPNPADEILYVELNKDFAFMSCDIKIINLLGNTVLEKSINVNNNQRIKLDISLIPGWVLYCFNQFGCEFICKKSDYLLNMLDFIFLYI